jgi:hypothetical protein
MDYINNLEEKLNKLNLNGVSATESSIAIKKLFSSFFNNDEKFTIYANHIGKDWDKYVDEEVEYLYDLTVIVNELSNIEFPFLTKTLLVLESEWGNLKQIVEDFQKLLISNATYKVLVFQQNQIENIDTIFTFLETNIEIYNRSNGTFYLCCFINNENKFRVKVLSFN